MKEIVLLVRKSLGDFNVVFVGDPEVSQESFFIGCPWTVRAGAAAEKIDDGTGCSEDPQEIHLLSGDRITSGWWRRSRGRQGSRDLGGDASTRRQDDLGDAWRGRRWLMPAGRRREIYGLARR